MGALVAATSPESAIAQSTQLKSRGLKTRLSSVQKQAQGVRAELKEKKKQVFQVAEDLRQLDSQMTTLEESLANTRDQLEKERKEQAALVEQLRQGEVKLEEKRIMAARRIRSMYMSSNETALSLLIGARTLSDFASRQALLERIAHRDRALFEEVKILCEQVAAKKKVQDAQVLRIAKLESTQSAEQSRLDAVKARKATALGRLRNERNELEDELAAMERTSKELQAQILAFQTQNQGRFETYRGGFRSPVSGRHTSGFGYRIHPITHTRRLHTGVDIAAPTGTPIYAAGSGVVISAGWRNGYGNAVVIDHGGGRSTLYGHCSRLFVQEGQKVSAGHHIAAVGSTGFSTGPHLHFEVRINGVPVDPRGR
ncbi:MAG: peptidoglycan DD-metalloendopeptidase family protein [Fimbriimonadaceae bacterium]|nr:peptidoglycan DD-metalloendopeptidase family protein [Fimbriimonadaceae bacterium]QYK56763.1 MAG: peptidoglycan DD-metalloendopeptidase family protein [Fimbriimonadaceae bacterium]